MWELVALIFFWTLWGVRKRLSLSHLAPQGRRCQDVRKCSNAYRPCDVSRAKWMKMSREFWSKYSPCVKTSPRRSKADALAGLRPFCRLFFVLDLELSPPTTAIVLIHGVHCDLAQLLLQRFLGTSPRRRCSPQNCVGTSNQQRWQTVPVISSESTAGISYAPQLCPTFLGTWLSEWCSWVTRCIVLACSLPLGHATQYEGASFPSLPQPQFNFLPN